MSIIIGQTTVQYNRKAQTWTAVNGSLNSAFPSGAAGKQAAVVAAVQHENAQLYKLARFASLKRPRLAKQYWKAAQGLINQMVLPPRAGNLVHEIAQVKSHSQPDNPPYSIQYRDEGLVCGCEGFQFRSAPTSDGGQVCCWHIIATVLALNLGHIPPPGGDSHE